MEIKCKWCGQLIETNNINRKYHTVNNKGVFCYKEAQNYAFVGKDEEDIKNNKIRKCKKCKGNVYYIPEERKWWCVKCGLKYTSYAKQIKPANKEYSRICQNPNCEKQFTISENRIRKGEGIYCSDTCKHDHMKGANSPTWNGGKSFEPYCPKFNDTIKEAVRAHFNYTCFYCGEKQNGGRKLSVHHVNYDKGQGCSGEWLLIPLCSSCHAKTNHNRDYWEEYFTTQLSTLNFECGLTRLKKTCRICGHHFIPDHAGTKYCSDSCKDIAKRDCDEKARRKYHTKYRRTPTYYSTLLGSARG